jgi:hypothetical protein
MPNRLAADSARRDGEALRLKPDVGQTGKARQFL